MEFHRVLHTNSLIMGRFQKYGHSIVSVVIVTVQSSHTRPAKVLDYECKCSALVVITNNSPEK